MSNTKTHVTFVLDSSGSMSKIADDTKGGFNTFLLDQREEPGSATVTLYDFNDSVRLAYESIPIGEAEKLTNDNYTPGGQTALHDAISTAITDTDDDIQTRSDAAQPDTVVVVILTDGKENASETPEDRVRELIEEYTERGWEFLFIGANQDAALTAEQMGIDADQSLTMDHSGDGTRAAYDSVSRNVSEARNTGSTDGFNDRDRQRQRDADSS